MYYLEILSNIFAYKFYFVPIFSALDLSLAFHKKIHALAISAILLQSFDAFQLKVTA